MNTERAQVDPAGPARPGDPAAAAPAAIDQAAGDAGQVLAAPALDLRTWNVEQCAAYLQKSKRWVWEALAKREDQEGSIPHTRIGRAPRFDPDTIRDWLLAGAPPAADFKTLQRKRTR